MRQYRGWANYAQNLSLILETVWGFFISVTKAEKTKQKWLIDCAEESDPEAWTERYYVAEDYPFDLIEQYKLADDGMFSIKQNE